jgi:dienelactone hydrolase
MHFQRHPSRRQFVAEAGAALIGGLAAQPLPAAGPPHAPAVDDWIGKLADEAPLALEFGGRTADECRKWQSDFAARLRALLGPHAPPAEWKVERERAVDLKDHRREELVLTAEGCPPLPVHILLPADKAGKRPGVLAIHGHGDLGYDAVVGKDEREGAAAELRTLNYDYGRQLARRGYVVAAPCLTPFGRRLGDPAAYGKQDPCAVTFVRLMLLGKVLMAENLRDCLWALAHLGRREEVDPERLACVGLSYGGRMTMLTAALEPRVKVAVVSGALNLMQERVAGRYSCGAQVIPGLLQYGDVPEIGSLIAPRRCVWEVGSRDSLLPPEWVDKGLARMRRAYRALDAEDHLVVDHFDGGHEWSGRLAYPLLEKELG